MSDENRITYSSQMYMPDGSPIPIVMTDEEAAKLLRLDESENPKLTLQYYREKRVLKGTRIGKRIRYTIYEIVEFLRKQTDETNKDV